MKNRNLVESDHLIKMFKNTIVIMHQIIPGIVYMTGIKTDSQPLLFVHSIIDCLNFFKGSSNLTALSCHRFQSNKYLILVLIQHHIQPADSLCNSGLCTRIQRGPRM